MTSTEFCSVDIETRSTTDLRKTGAAVYFENPLTDCWVACFAFDNEPVETWFPGDPIPQRFVEHVTAGGKFRGWNSGGFERIAFKQLLGPRHGWPVPTDNAWFDTAAQAAAQSLPRALDNAARALRLAFQKDLVGHRLMLQMCKPRHWLLPGGTVVRGEDAKNLGPEAQPVWWDEPAKIQRLAAYCRLDVETERAAAKVLRPLSDKEREVYLLDQRVNDIGARLDQDLVRSASAIVEEAALRLNGQMRRLTNGAVPKCSTVAALGRWLKTLGVELPTVASGDDDEEERDSLDKAALAKLLASDIPAPAREAIQLRQYAAKSSTAKLVAMRNTCCTDGRMRQLFLYHGASTGRFAGAKVQLQNLAKPTLPKIEDFIPDVLAGRFDHIDCLAPALEVVSGLLRGCLVPAPGKRFIVADFAAIEARVVAWLARQNDLVELFRTGGDPYCAMASKIYHRTITKADAKERQIGKALVLGAGFQMGGPKFKATAAKPPYWVDVTDEEAAEYIAVYRDSNSHIAALWRDMEDGAFEAVRRPGIVVPVANGKIRFAVRGRFLWMILPSSRPLAYAYPFIGKTMKPWGELQDAVRFFSVPSPDRRRKLSDDDARLPGTIPGKWQVTDVFGGLWTENAVQAIARDLLVDAMLRLEGAGYQVPIHAHDEVVAEVPIDFGSLDEVLDLMCRPLPKWASGLPVAAEGFETARYRK